MMNGIAHVSDAIKGGSMNGQQREEWLYAIWPDRLVENHSQIRACFLVELENYQKGIDPDFFENLYQAALYLYIMGDLDDAVRMYDAKKSSFDLQCGMDY